MNRIKKALEKCRTYVAVQKFGCGHTGIGHGVEDNLLQLLNEAFEELAWLEKREPTLMSDCISAGLPLDVALKYDVQLCRLTNYVRDKALADYVKQKTATVDRDAFLAGYEEAQADANSCCVPPQGWLCTRQSGHDGPCAVIADDKERELVSRGMSRLSEPVKQEPVGVVESSEEWGVAGVLIAGLPIGTKLYAAPVERQWVDLTDDEIDESWCIEPKPINGLLVAEPVKQEPVQEPTVTERQFKLAMNQWEDWKAYALELQARLVKYEGGSPMILNAAPVSAEAIRAEALEEAEEIAKTIGGSFSVEFLAAIRGLK